MADYNSGSAWPEVEWEGGYPSDDIEQLLSTVSVPSDFHRAANFLLSELPTCVANCCASCSVVDAIDELTGNRPAKRIEFSTGGWSGAESLIAVINARYDTRYFMLSWRRGGHYVFEVPMRFLATQEQSHEQ